MSDGNVPDSNVFQAIDFTSSTKTLGIHSTDEAYGDMYDFKVSVTYNDHSSVSASAYFSVDVIAC